MMQSGFGLLLKSKHDLDFDFQVLIGYLSLQS